MKLAHIGNPLMNLFIKAQIIRGKIIGQEMIERVADCYPNDLFNAIRDSPLPFVTNDGSRAIAEANELIGQVNTTADPVFLLRALNRLSQLTGDGTYRPFPQARYDPALLQAEAKS